MNEPSRLPADLTVGHDFDPATGQGRFHARVRGLLCVADYRRTGNVLQMHHTEVPPPLEGRGIAAALVDAAFAYADAHGLKIEPLCAYVRGYVQKHPQVRRLLT